MSTAGYASICMHAAASRHLLSFVSLKHTTFQKPGQQGTHWHQRHARQRAQACGSQWSACMIVSEACSSSRRPRLASRMLSDSPSAVSASFSRICNKHDSRPAPPADVEVARECCQALRHGPRTCRHPFRVSCHPVRQPHSAKYRHNPTRHHNTPTTLFAHLLQHPSSHKLIMHALTRPQCFNSYTALQSLKLSAVNHTCSCAEARLCARWRSKAASCRSLCASS